MGKAEEPASSNMEVDCRGLGRLRAAMAASMAMILVVLGLMEPSELSALVMVLFLCYLIVLLGVRGTPARIALGAARIVRVGGSLIGLLFLFLFGASVFLGVFVLAQLAVVVSATKTAHSMRRLPASGQ